MLVHNFKPTSRLTMWYTVLLAWTASAQLLHWYTHHMQTLKNDEHQNKQRSHLNMLNQSYAKTLSISLPRRLLIKSWNNNRVRHIHTLFLSISVGSGWRWWWQQRERQPRRLPFTNNAVNNEKYFDFRLSGETTTTHSLTMYNILTKLSKRNKTNNFWITTAFIVSTQIKFEWHIPCIYIFFLRFLSLSLSLNLRLFWIYFYVSWILFSDFCSKIDSHETSTVC